MKKIQLFILSALLTITAFTQFFEGKITYQNSFKSKMHNITDDQLTKMMGATQEYFIKNGDYKSVSDGTIMQWQLYVAADNKLYNKMSNSETVLWNDGSINKDSVLSATVNKNALEILGYPCDELILTCTSGMQKYYYNSKLAVNPALFARHKFGNWYAFVSKSKALPLKMIIDSKDFTLESTATEVKPGEKEPGFFKLPANTKTAKSPY